MSIKKVKTDQFIDKVNSAIDIKRSILQDFAKLKTLRQQCKILREYVDKKYLCQCQEKGLIGGIIDAKIETDFKFFFESEHWREVIE